MQKVFSTPPYGGLMSGQQQEVAEMAQGFVAMHNGEQGA
jgi:hypothetical protein